MADENKGKWTRFREWTKSNAGLITRGAVAVGGAITLAVDLKSRLGTSEDKPQKKLT